MGQIYRCQFFTSGHCFVPTLVVLSWDVWLHRQGYGAHGVCSEPGGAGRQGLLLLMLLPCRPCSLNDAPFSPLVPLFEEHPHLPESLP